MHNDDSGALLRLYTDRGVTFSHGEGCRLFTPTGKSYLDGTSGYGVALFGYGNREILAALSQQTLRLTTLHGSFRSPLRERVSRKLRERCSLPDYKVLWTNSGAEAVEAALKFAVLTSGKRRFLSFRGGYHGKTLGALSATPSGKYRQGLEPLLWEFTFLELGDESSFETALNDQFAAVIVEPIQGEGGVLLPPPGFLKRVRELCTDRGVLLILDEIQSGMGRSGTLLAGDQEGASGDLLLLGKGLSGGIPAGAVLVHPEVAERIPRLSHTSTFGGNPLACAGTEAVLNLLTEEFLERVVRLGHSFREGLSARTPGATVRGKGLMVGVDVGKPRRDHLLKALQREGVLALPAGEGTVRFLPPLTIAREEIQEILDAWSRAWEA